MEAQVSFTVVFSSSKVVGLLFLLISAEKNIYSSDMSTTSFKTVYFYLCTFKMTVQCCSLSNKEYKQNVLAVLVSVNLFLKCRKLSNTVYIKQT